MKAGNIKLFQFEKYFFFFIVLLHLIPMLSVKYFVTHDGPAHVYNAHLINNLLFHKDSIASNFFELTPGIVPNWIGHALIAFFSLFLPYFISEKVLLCIYIISFAFFFSFF